MSIIHQSNIVAQSVISNGLVTGNQVQNPNNLLNTTNSTAIFGATSDVIIGNFPFNLPQDAIIVGISGILKARIDNNSIPAGSITPALVVNGQYFPTTPIVGLSDVLQEYSFGGAYDIWGNISWNSTKINNINLQLLANSSLEVAWASLTVFYYIPQISPVPPPFNLPGCEDCDSEIQALPFELAQPWLSNQTKLILRSFNLPNGDPITLSMLGDCGGTINLTIDPDLRKEDGGNFIENFNIDASLATITFQPNGTVEIDLGDIEQRGLAFTTPYGHNPDYISEHAVGAVVIISNNGPWNSKLLKKCHIGTLVSAPITVEDEGETIGVAIDIFNFRGENIQANQDVSDPYKVNIDVVTQPTNVKPIPGSTSQGSNGTTPSNSLTISHTIGVDENYLRVWVSTQDVTISSVTYDGVAMSLVAVETNAVSDLKGALYELINPSVGANDIIITVGTSSLISGGGIGFENVDTTNPTDSISSGNSGSDNAPADSITTTVDNVLIQDVVSTKTNPTTFTQYGIWNIESSVSAAGRPGASSVRPVLVPQTVNDQYGLNVPMDWVIVLAGIRGQVPNYYVETVTGLNTDNTDPKNPVVKISVDGTTVTGDGTPGNPLVSTGGGGGTPLEIEEEGVSVDTNVTKINFTGAGATATQTSPGVVRVDIPSGSGGVQSVTGPWVNNTIPTNPYVGPKNLTVVSPASVNVNSDNVNVVNIGPLANAITINNPTGSPVNGQGLIYRMIDNGTTRIITWDTDFEGIVDIPPDRTISGKLMYVGFKYNSTSSKWNMVAYVVQY